MPKTSKPAPRAKPSSHTKKKPSGSRTRAAASAQTGKTGKSGKSAGANRGGSPATRKSGKTNDKTARARSSSKTAGVKGKVKAGDAESRRAGEMAIDAALDRKALAPVLIDVSQLASYTDFIAIVSGRSERQVQAICENVEKVMKDRGQTLIGREGRGNGRWTLLDYGDVVVHIFYHPVRGIYDIEGLWVEAPRVTLKDVPPEANNFQDDALYALS